MRSRILGKVFFHKKKGVNVYSQRRRQFLLYDFLHNNLKSSFSPFLYKQCELSEHGAIVLSECFLL
jgi:hypothetical protein